MVWKSIYQLTGVTYTRPTRNPNVQNGYKICQNFNFGYCSVIAFMILVVIPTQLPTPNTNIITKNRTENT